MEHAFLFAVIITLKLTLITGLVAYFDTMNMKDRQLLRVRADEDSAELYDGIK